MPTMLKPMSKTKRILRAVGRTVSGRTLLVAAQKRRINSLNQQERARNTLLLKGESLEHNVRFVNQKIRTTPSTESIQADHVVFNAQEYGGAFQKYEKAKVASDKAVGSVARVTGLRKTWVGRKVRSMVARRLSIKRKE